MAKGLQNEIDELLRKSTGDGDVPGVVAILADQGGLIYEGASGKRTLGGSAAFTPDTVAWCASMTKAITAAAAMQLVERGKVKLDDPAAKVCPELDKLKVLEGFDTKGQPKLRAPESRLTLRQLLTHTGGSSYEFNDEDTRRYLEVTGTPGIISGAKATLMRPLLCDPGTRWDYGVGIDWAGRMVEEISGKRLGDYMRDELFAPLGMNATGFKVSEEGRKKQAGVHARTPDGSLVAIPFELPADAELDMGGHGLSGPMTDYIRFLRAILGGGKLEGDRVLESKTVADMGQNHTGSISMRPIKTAMPDLCLDADFFPGVDCKYGLSFMINTSQIPGGRSAGSMAWAGLTNSYFWIDPVKRVTGVLLTQILPFFDSKVIDLLTQVERTTYRYL